MRLPLWAAGTAGTSRGSTNVSPWPTRTTAQESPVQAAGRVTRVDTVRAPRAAPPRSTSSVTGRYPSDHSSSRHESHYRQVGRGGRTFRSSSTLVKSQVRFLLGGYMYGNSGTTAHGCFDIVATLRDGDVCDGDRHGLVSDALGQAHGVAGDAISGAVVNLDTQLPRWVDLPRVRGEHSAGSTTRSLCDGSSPRARGAQ